MNDARALSALDLMNAHPVCEDDLLWAVNQIQAMSMEPHAGAIVTNLLRDRPAMDPMAAIALASRACALLLILEDSALMHWVVLEPGSGDATLQLPVLQAAASMPLSIRDNTEGPYPGFDREGFIARVLALDPGAANVLAA